jgi:hypothetical protein
LARGSAKASPWNLGEMLMFTDLGLLATIKSITTLNRMGTQNPVVKHIYVC